MSGLPADYNQRSINPETRMDHGLYSFSALPDRPKLVWPNDAKVAIAVVINVEAGDLAENPRALVPFSHREYGPRVGVFRLMGILDDFGIKATMPVSDAVLTRSPAVVEHALQRGWEFAGHGEKVNKAISSAMSESDEKAYIEASFAALKAATGKAPRGWLGPSLTESAHTTALLAAAGFDYTMDWGNDDQPYDFIVPSGKLSALPYSPDTSDAAVIQAQAHTPWEFGTGLEDHLERLLDDGETTGMAMTLGLQANVSGQPFRSKYIRKFLEKAVRISGVWFATGSEIIDAYRRQSS